MNYEVQYRQDSELWGRMLPWSTVSTLKKAKAHIAILRQAHGHKYKFRIVKVTRKVVAE